MRMLVLKQDRDLATLTDRVTVKGGAIAWQRLKALNPHLDFGRLDAGSVLLVPDDVDGAEPVAGAVFDALAADLKQGLGGAADRIRKGQAQSEAMRSDVEAAVSSAAFKRVIDGDAELARQVADTASRANAERLRAKETEGSLAALNALVDSELAVLRGLIG